MFHKGSSVINLINSGTTLFLFCSAECYLTEGYYAQNHSAYCYSAKTCPVECHSAESHSGECHSAESHSGECHSAWVIVLRFEELNITGELVLIISIP